MPQQHLHRPLSWPAWLAIGLGSLPGLAAQATPITSITQVGYFVENRSPSSISGAAGVYTAITANALPNGGAGTTATATRGTTTVDLPWVGGSANPNQFYRLLSYNPARLTPWTLTFQNGSDSRSVTTPSLTGGYVMPFATDVSLSGSTFTPTVNWQVPVGAQVDGVRINIFDVDRRNLAGNGADLVFSQTFTGDARSFTVPETLVNGLPLQAGHHYTMEVGLLDSRDDRLPGLANILTRSRLYVDFTPVISPGGAEVFLPTVTPGVGGAAPTFSFSISEVGAESLTYIDPVVAVGYDYAIGVDDPLFRAVLLPEGIGDGEYLVELPDGSRHAVSAGDEFDFTAFAADGVARFRVLGIETSAGLSPDDGTAFVTGLRFMRNGHFTGTMVPVLAEIPEPASLALVLAALTGLRGLAARRRRQPMAGRQPAG